MPKYEYNLIDSKIQKQMLLSKNHYAIYCFKLSSSLFRFFKKIICFMALTVS